MAWSTVEVRWFIAGPCPPSVSEWFHSVSRAGDPERRTDLYLGLRTRDDLGVKQRGSALLDLKLRTGARADILLPDGLNGRVEAWTKWSFSLDESVRRSSDGPWISVDKTRWTRLYTVADPATAVAVPAGAIPSNGCAAELVEATIGEAACWGFGFEAFATDFDAGEALAAGSRATLADTPLGDLSFAEADSHSYPSWLQRWPNGRGAG